MNPLSSQKIKSLELRILELETELAKYKNSDEQVFMNELFKKAELLSSKGQVLSAVFLQKKFLIDLPRAKALLDRLSNNNK